jgi:excisionase family DNA binding protein
MDTQTQSADAVVLAIPATENSAPEGKRPTSVVPLVVDLRTAAEMLAVSKRTIERLRDLGELRCLRVGAYWKVRVSEIHAYLRRCEAKSR